MEHVLHEVSHGVGAVQVSGGAWGCVGWGAFSKGALLC